MAKTESLITFPRHRVVRVIVRALGRLIFRVLFRVRITGRENFPKEGPLVVVGNHVAVIEAALMALFTPWPIELLGAGDMPQETIVEIVEWLYDYIPIDRGNVDRAALRKALLVLEQGGFLGLFPEGGLWEPGAMRAQTGVAWLSYRGNAPVLPVAFSGTLGALNAALKLKRPRLIINVGEIIPAAELPEDQGRKPYLQFYANHVMDEVKGLLTPDDPSLQPKIKEERFELTLTLTDQGGVIHLIPPELEIKHPDALTKFLHRPSILKIFRVNFDLPIDPVQNLHTEPIASEICRSLALIVKALENDYPYLLTYRFGPQQGEKMQLGLTELLALAECSASWWGVGFEPTLRGSPQFIRGRGGRRHQVQRTQKPSAAHHGRESASSRLCVAVRNSFAGAVANYSQVKESRTMKHKEGFFTGVREKEIYYQAWLPEGEAKAVLLVVHGMAEHCGRYGNVVDHFVPLGYAVYGLDHVGHGKSEGTRVYVESFDDYTATLKLYFDMVRASQPEKPIFLVGHSMGSLISTAYLLGHQAELSGAVLSGVLAQVPEDVSPLVILMGKVFSSLFPKMGLMGLDANAVSKDPAVVEAYVNDPLVYTGKYTARLGAEMLKTLDRVSSQAGTINLPLLLLQGGEDKLVDPSGAKVLYDVASSGDKTLKLYEGLYHEVFNEPERERVLQDLETWLEQRVP